MKRIVVTGASGFLGWNTVRVLVEEGYETVGVFCRHRVEIDGAVAVGCDLADAASVEELLARSRPDVVIHCAARADTGWCRRFPEESHRVNVGATALLAAACVRHHCRMLFVSTDLVFDGARGSYREDDRVNPLCVYGHQKALAESAVREAGPEHGICRLPLMFGDGGPAGSSFLQPLLARLAAGERLPLFVDEYRTPVCARTAAGGLLLAAQTGCPLLHLGGRERISRYELGCRIARIWGYSEESLAPVRQRDVPLCGPRPPDTSLVSEQAFSLGYRPGSVEEQLTCLKRTGTGC